MPKPIEQVLKKLISTYLKTKARDLASSKISQLADFPPPSQISRLQYFIQRAESVERSIGFVYHSGAAPHISYFSPIPGTKIWQDVLKSTPFPVDEEPLFQNNTVFILGNREFTEETIGNLKSMAIELRKRD